MAPLLCHVHRLVDDDRWHEHRSSLSRARRHVPHAVLLHAGGMGMGGMGMDGMGGMGNFGDSDDVPPQ